MARILVQATLPHSRPRTHEFERVNGRFTLYMNAPPSVGLPYGSYPRLAFAWLSTEAVRTRSREIELGPTFSSFMYKLGLTPITGKRGTTSRLRDHPQAPNVVVTARSRTAPPVELGGSPERRVL
jgi:hypothetical protein